MSGLGVLWDMDGVLVDSGPYHYQAWAAVCQEYGIPFSRELFRQTFGMNNAGILALLMGQRLTPGLLAEISDRKEQQFRQAVQGHVRPLPGVRVWLDRLKAAGVRQALATSAPPANIDALLGELGLRPCFDAIVSGERLPGKPEPALFLAAALEIGVPPGRCAVVEDAVAGVAAAKRAGMKCIAVTTTNPAAALQGADLVVDSLEALPADAFERLWDTGAGHAGESA